MKDTTIARLVAGVGAIWALWVLAYRTNPLLKAHAAIFLVCIFAFLVGLELQKRGH